MKKMQNFGPRRRRRERSTVSRFEKCLPSSKTVGCITGVFRFFARQQHNSSTRRLPSGRRKDQFWESPPRSLPPPEKRMKVEVPAAGETRKDPSHATTAAVSLKHLISLPQKHSCESPRSPTLPPEIRKLGTFEVTDSPRCRQPTLMERLMGLDDAPVSSPESSKEKWRKIVVTTDKCEDHLKSLKRIIDAARAAESQKSAAAKVELGSDQFSLSEDGDDSIESTGKCMDGSEEQPSPVSVLDPISRTKFSANRSKQRKCSILQPKQEIPVLQSRDSQPSGVAVVSSEEISVLQSRDSQSSDVVISSKEKNQESMNTKDSIKESDNLLEGMPRMLKRSELVEDFVQASKAAEIGRLRRLRWTMSQAMVATVCEVLERVTWEERKEAGGVVVALERGIFGDLVEDLGRDLALHCRTTMRGTCRKRLHF